MGRYADLFFNGVKSPLDCRRLCRGRPVVVVALASVTGEELRGLLSGGEALVLTPQVTQAEKGIRVLPLDGPGFRLSDEARRAIRAAGRTVVLRDGLEDVPIRVLASLLRGGVRRVVDHRRTGWRRRSLLWALLGQSGLRLWLWVLDRVGG